MARALDKDGGFAFPQSETANGNSFGAEYADGGMTLRDYFAAKALQGLISNSLNGTPDGAAKIAYEFADAMLKHRETA